MKDEIMRLVFSSEVRDLTARNTSFDSGVLRVAYAGKNRNGSYISKDVFEKCIPSIYNCPIVCNYDRDSGTIGAHDMDVVGTADKGLRLVNLTQPVGVVPESAKYWWETVADESGDHEYLCVEVLLWKRQEAYQKIKQDGITDESMEIAIKEGRMVDNVYQIDRFEFTAFCLLGSAEPCYESAALELFTLDKFKEQMADMMKELCETYETKQSPDGVVISNDVMEGGDEGLNEKMELLAEYGLELDALDFSIADLTMDELRKKFEAMKKAAQDDDDPEPTNEDDEPEETGEPANEPDAEPEDDEDNQSDESENFALEGQVRDELIRELRTEKVQTCFGEMCRYWFIDYDPEVSEVYAEDEEDWLLYGIPYTMDGDRVIIDFAGKKRKKYAIVDFDNGSAVPEHSPIAEAFAVISEKYTENDNQWKEKYEEAQTEINSLSEYKRESEAAKYDAMLKQVAEKFADLVGNEAFNALMGSDTKYNLDTLEEKCYAIRGRCMNTGAKFSVEQKPPKLPVLMKDNGAEPYGGVFAEYGIK